MTMLDNARFDELMKDPATTKVLEKELAHTLRYALEKWGRDPDARAYEREHGILRGDLLLEQRAEILAEARDAIEESLANGEALRLVNAALDRAVAQIRSYVEARQRRRKPARTPKVTA